jgi:glycosyltransferase involved in cell wall biosynthesis
MPATPLVSLLIPTFNNGRTVADSIASCLNQTFRDLEIILYDEASQDNTRAILQEAASRDPRIKVMVSDSNSGPVRAWRKLLHAASGRWSTFVWSDDLLLPDYLERLLAVLEKNPKHLLAGCNCYIDDCKESPAGGLIEFKPYTPTGRQRRLHEFDTLTLKGDEYALGILADVFPVNQICSLFNTQAAREVFDHYIEFENPYGFDFSRHAYGNDVAFLSELGLRSGELTEIGDPLVVVRGSPASMTVNARRSHRWQYWLQYIWAFRTAWTRCRHLSPRMNALIRVADDRVSFCDTFYSLQKGRWPRLIHPAKFMRAGWFLLRQDHRINRGVSVATVQAWLARHGQG